MIMRPTILKVISFFVSDTPVRGPGPLDNEGDPVLFLIRRRDCLACGGPGDAQARERRASMRGAEAEGWRGEAGRRGGARLLGGCPQYFMVHDANRT